MTNRMDRHGESSSSRSGRLQAWTERHTDSYGRPAVWLGLNVYRPVYQANPFAHAGKPQSLLSGGYEIEPFALIINDEVNLAGMFAHLYFHALYPAVLDCIMQAFLKNAKQCEANFRREETGNVAREIDLDFVPLTEFFTPASYAPNNSQILQFCGVQFMRECLYVV